MKKASKGWLANTLVKLLSSFKGQRFHNRQVRAQPGSRIITDSFGSPVVPIPALDRLVAKVTGSPLLVTLARRSGLDVTNLQHMSPKEINRTIRTLSGRRTLQLFYIDATTNNSQLLAALLEENPDILEQLVQSLSRNERNWVLQLFGEPAPSLTPPAAENCALMLSRLSDRQNIAPILTQLLSQSDTVSEAAALEGLYQGQQLDFGLLEDLSKAFSPQAGQTRDAGRDMISNCYWNAQRNQNTPLAKHLQVFMDMMYQSLPQYKEYWSTCTGQPAENCPVSHNYPSFHSNLSRLTLGTVNNLCKTTDETDFINIATNQGWKKIQARSSATLRNPDAATGDFIFRTFEEFKPHWQESLT